MSERMYGENGRHPYRHWIESYRCWRLAQKDWIESVPSVEGLPFSRVVKLYENWWQSASVYHPHGWNITIKARGIRK